MDWFHLISVGAHLDGVGRRSQVIGHGRKLCVQVGWIGFAGLDIPLCSSGLGSKGVCMDVALVLQKERGPSGAHG